MDTNSRLTVSEAAQELGISLPRLMRLLKRPDMAPFVSQAERATRTGVRKATFVRRSALEYIRTRALTQDVPSAQPIDVIQSESGLVPADPRDLMAALIRSKDAEIAEKNRHLDTKDAVIAEKNEHIRLLSAQLAGLQQQRETVPVPSAERPVSAVPLPAVPRAANGLHRDIPKSPKPPEPPKTALERFWRWFREA